MTKQHGGKRPGAGRRKGSQNKRTTELGAKLSELAQAHTENALRVLVDVAMNGSNDGARVSAASAILDRAYGKPKQSVDLEATVDVNKTLADFYGGNGNT